MAARRKPRKTSARKSARKRARKPVGVRKLLAAKQRERGYADRTLAERLVHVRQQHGLTQTDVATEAGIPFDTLGNYERCEATAPFWRVRQLAIYYGISLDYLAGRTSRLVYSKARKAGKARKARKARKKRGRRKVRR